MWQILLLNALFAMTYPLSKGALAYSSPLLLTSIRLLVGGFLLFFFCVSRKKGPLIQKGDLLTFVVAAFLYNLVYLTSECWSLQYLSNSKTYALYLLSPIVSACLGYFVFGERLSRKKYLGLAIGLFGCLPLIFTNSCSGQLLKPALRFLPECMMIIGVIAGTYTWFLTAKLLNKGYSPLVVNGITTLQGGILNALLLLVKKEPIARGIFSCKPFWIYVILLVLLIDIIGSNMYYRSIQKHTVTFIVFAEFLGLIFNMLYDYAFFSQPLSWVIVAGFVPLVIGVYIYQQDESTPGQLATQAHIIVQSYKEKLIQQEQLPFYKQKKYIRFPHPQQSSFITRANFFHQTHRKFKPQL